MRVKVIRPGPLVDFAAFEPPGRSRPGSGNGVRRDRREEEPAQRVRRRHRGAGDSLICRGLRQCTGGCEPGGGAGAHQKGTGREAAFRAAGSEDLVVSCLAPSGAVRPVEAAATTAHAQQPAHRLVRRFRERAISPRRCRSRHRQSGCSGPTGDHRFRSGGRSEARPMIGRHVAPAGAPIKVQDLFRWARRLGRVSDSERELRSLILPPGAPTLLAHQHRARGAVAAALGVPVARAG